MTLKRTSNNNYSDFAYTSEVKKLLNVTLNKRDENKLKKIYTNFYELESSRSYEPIIEDLYILVEKHHLSTKQLSEIYHIGVRSIQKWLKELRINRSISKAHKISNKSTVIKKGIEIESLSAQVSEAKTIASPFLPIQSGLKPQGSRAAISFCGLITISENAPTR